MDLHDLYGVVLLTSWG